MLARPGLAACAALASVLAFALPALAQEGGFGEDSPPAGDAPAAKAPAAQVDTRVEVTGNRYRFKLRTGAVIEGVLPRGIHWEKLDPFGDFVEAQEKDRGSGLRVQYILNMEGDIFIKREDIAVMEGGKLDIRDLGALTEKEKLAIRQRIIADRKRVLEQREKALNEEIARLTRGKEKDKDGEDGEGGEEKKEGPDAETIRKGEALLEKFPPADWSEDRLKEILRREVINGIYRNDEEREFIDNFKAWKDALDRREAEKQKKEGAKEGAGAPGSAE